MRSLQPYGERPKDGGECGTSSYTFTQVNIIIIIIVVIIIITTTTTTTIIILISEMGLDWRVQNIWIFIFA